MNLGKTRNFVVSAVALTSVLILSGCGVLPGFGSGGPSPQGASPGTPTVESSHEDPALVVLDEDEVVPFPQFERSTPAGSWPVGDGIPAGFPAGVPVFADRWIEGNAHEFESRGRYGYAAMFWGGYDHIDQLVERLRELGYDVSQETDDTKRVVVADSHRDRVVITGTESAVNPGETEVLDPSYTISIVLQG